MTEEEEEEVTYTTEGGSGDEAEPDRSTTPAPGALADGEAESDDENEEEDEEDQPSDSAEDSGNEGDGDEDENEDAKSAASDPSSRSDSVTGSTTTGVTSPPDLESDTSGVTDEDPHMHYTPPAGDYVPHHHWDTRLSARFKRYQEKTSERARTHWSALRTNLIGHKSPLARLAGVVRNLMSPAAGNGGDGGDAASSKDGSSVAASAGGDVEIDPLPQRLFNARGATPPPDSDNGPMASPMVLTISTRPPHPCARCCAFWGRPLALLAGLLFMAALGWLLLGLVPGMFENRLLTGADRDSARASGGCSIETVEKMVKVSNRQSIAYADSVVRECRGQCEDGLRGVNDMMRELRHVQDSLRQHHDGSIASVNSNVTAVRDALLDRVMKLDVRWHIVCMVGFAFGHPTHLLC